MSAGVEAHRGGHPRARGAAVPRAPRRVSGPARPARSPRPGTAGGAVAGRAGHASPPAGARALERLRALPDSRWLDRLLRGRAWIALIAVGLIGIVGMQVHLLKLNAGIGRAVEHSATLERQNADLRAEVSQLSSQERIQQAAAQMGLVMPAAGRVVYVHAGSVVRDAQRAVQTIRTPNTPQQVAQAQAQAQQARAQAQALAAQQAAASGTAAPSTATTPSTTPAPATPAAPATP